MGVWVRLRQHYVYVDGADTLVYLFFSSGSSNGKFAPEIRPHGLVSRECSWDAFLASSENAGKGINMSKRRIVMIWSFGFIIGFLVMLMLFAYYP